MKLDVWMDELPGAEDLTEEERAELLDFSVGEATALGVAEAATHWHENVRAPFTKAERPHMNLWVSGLSWSQDLFVAAALRGVGYHVRPLPVPDYESLRVGKEFGNRGQCNPTYFTVGNLVKHLQTLEADGVPRQELIDRHVFLTAGACGPCRFGMYVTEFRKALRDAGFDGFRVMLFQQQGGVRQATGEENGLEIDATFFKALLTAFLVGDVLNLLGYRIRPYEVEPGATDAAIEAARAMISSALEEGRSVHRALYRSGRELRKVAVNYDQPKPIVAVMGEFWAMTTEGDGNYRLQRFLEEEGAEVHIQPMINWLLFILWEQSHDTASRLTLRRDDDARKGLRGKDGWKKLMMLKAAKPLIVGVFKSFAYAIGLFDHHLPDMDDIARLAKPYYDTEQRGGEAHMEVGKLIDSVLHSRAHMVLSVKPFGCMPSSGISDGVQSKIQSEYPHAIFLPIETSGDGEVNVQSRVQMMLFKAHQRARSEYAAGERKRAGLRLAGRSI